MSTWIGIFRMDLQKWNLGAGSKPMGDKQMMKGPGLFPVYFPLLGESVVNLAEPADKAAVHSPDGRTNRGALE